MLRRLLARRYCQLQSTKPAALPALSVAHVQHACLGPDCGSWAGMLHVPDIGPRCFQEFQQQSPILERVNIEDGDERERNGTHSKSGSILLMSAEK